MVSHLHRQTQLSVLAAITPAPVSNPRYTTAIPNTTHKNAVVSKITPVIWKNAVRTPIIAAAITTHRTHPHRILQLQLIIPIVSPPGVFYVAPGKQVPNPTKKPSRLGGLLMISG
jgi:hypothetical protein